MNNSPIPSAKSRPKVESTKVYSSLKTYFHFDLQEPSLQIYAPQSLFYNNMLVTQTADENVVYLSRNTSCKYRQFLDDRVNFFHLERFSHEQKVQIHQLQQIYVCTLRYHACTSLSHNNYIRIWLCATVK